MNDLELTKFFEQVDTIGDTMVDNIVKALRDAGESFLSLKDQTGDLPQQAKTVFAIKLDQLCKRLDSEVGDLITEFDLVD